MNQVISIIVYHRISSHFIFYQPTSLPDSKTLIDDIFFNSIEHQSISGNLLIEISDHLIQFLILQGFVKEISLSETNLYRRDFSNFNEREFEETTLDMNVNEREFEETTLDMNVNEREFEETTLDMNVNEREFEETILDMNVNEREFEETILDMNVNEREFEETILDMKRQFST